MTTISRPIPRAFSAVGGAIRSAPLAAFALTLGFVLLLLGLGTTAYEAFNSGKALPGVSIAGVPVGGMDRAGAEARLRAVLPALDSGFLSADVDGTERQISFQELGRDYAIAAMLDRALAVGRGGNILESAVGKLSTLAGGTDVAPEVTWNEDALLRFLDAVASSEAIAPADASVVRGASDEYTVSAARSGRVIDVSALRTMAVAGLSRPVADDVIVTVQPGLVEPLVATPVAEAAVGRFNAATSSPVNAGGGGVSAYLDSTTLRSWVSLQPSATGVGWEVVLDTTAVSAHFAPYATQIDRQAVDATFEMTADGPAAVAGVAGQAFSLAETVDRVAQLISARAGGATGSSVELAVTTIDPSFTTAQATELASQIEMVSSWTTRFIPGPSNFFGRNIRTPAKILSGTIVEPGERFSFLDGVGEISPATGFGPGGAIIRGHTNETGAVGGGICSASTTLFNAALRYGYEIVSRTQHSYYISRYPVGLDATVFRSGGSQTDMVFVNDSQYPLWIRGLAGKGKVTFQIWTVPDGRTVEISKADVSNRRQAEDTVKVIESMEPGTSKRVEYPVDGFDATVTREVREAGGAILHTDTFRSHYITVTGVTEVGPTREPEPTEPPPTEPPPSEPPPSEPPPAP